MATPKTETRVEYDANAIIPHIEKFHEPKPIDIHATHLVAIPSGLKLQSTKEYVDALREHPERRQGTAHFTSLESFCEHTNRFKSEHSAVFAVENMAAPKLVSVLDYHEKGATGTPRFAQHRGVYAFPLSDEWNAWRGVDGKSLAQDVFAQLIEDRIGDVIDPTKSAGEGVREVADQMSLGLAGPSRLITLSRGLALRVESKVVNTRNLTSGEMQLTYEEVHKEQDGSGPLTIPGAFVIGIPVFRGGELFQVLARLRYRTSNGQVHWTVALHRIDRVFEAAFSDACASAKDLVELPLFYGTPE